MKLKHILLSTTLLILLAPQLAQAKLKVVATVGDHAAVAQAVGGEHVEVELLASPQEDPHFVDAKPSFVRRLAEADLLIANGMALETGWLPTLVKSSRNAKVQPGNPGYFDASEHVQKKDVRSGKVSRAEGDVHPEGNPHYSISPGQMARMSIALGKRLSELDTANTESYKKQARGFAKRALHARSYWDNKFSELPERCRQVVVYHEAWDYLTDWLKLTPVIAVEPKPGVPPNPKHIAKVFEAIQSKELPVIIQMEYYPNTNTEMLAERTGAYLLTVEGHTRQGADYVSRVNKMAGELFSAIKARCD